MMRVQSRSPHSSCLFAFLVLGLGATGHACRRPWFAESRVPPRKSVSDVEAPMLCREWNSHTHPPMMRAWAERRPCRQSRGLALVRQTLHRGHGRQGADPHRLPVRRRYAIASRMDDGYDEGWLPRRPRLALRGPFPCAGDAQHRQDLATVPGLLYGHLIARGSRLHAPLCSCRPTVRATTARQRSPSSASRTTNRRRKAGTTCFLDDCKVVWENDTTLSVTAETRGNNQALRPCSSPGRMGIQIVDDV